MTRAQSAMCFTTVKSLHLALESLWFLIKVQWGLALFHPLG